MEIKIGDNFIVTSDEYNWILKQKQVSDPNHRFSKSKTPVERFVVVGYFGKIEQLTNSLLERYLKVSEATNIQDLIKTLQQAQNVLKIDVEKESNKWF